MDKIKILSFSLICIILLSLVGVNAIGCEEKYNEKEEKNYEDEFGKVVKVSSSLSFFDRIIERYPLLDKIIEIILELLYNWLSNYSLNLS